MSGSQSKTGGLAAAASAATGGKAVNSLKKAVALKAAGDGTASEDSRPLVSQSGPGGQHGQPQGPGGPRGGRGPGPPQQGPNQQQMRGSGDGGGGGGDASYGGYHLSYEVKKLMPTNKATSSSAKANGAGGAGNKSLEVGIADDQAKDFDFEKTEMKYDSTGMFHWTPARAIEDCILVRLS